MTPLDQAHATLVEAGDTDAARLRFYERLADAELFLLLETEAVADKIEPQIFSVDGSEFVLAFDLEERLVDFVGQPAPYACLSGRALVTLLAPQALGLGLNLEVAPSSYLMDAQGVGWLADTLQAAPEEAEAKVVEMTPPGAMPELLLSALDAKLALMGAAARSAYLAQVTYDNGAIGHMLAFIDAAPGAEGALSKAASEALTFSGIEAGQLDVAFFRASDAVAATLAKVGLRFDLPEPPEPQVVERPAPGMDPDKPPRLR